MMKKFRVTLIMCMALFLLVMPGMAGTPQTVPLGGNVFIGEQDLNLWGISAGTTLSYYSGSQVPGQSAPSTMITVGNPGKFYVAPSSFVGRTGYWYIGTTKTIGIVVNDPSQAVSVFDQQTGKDVTGQSVTAGDFLVFRMDTNLKVVPAERNSGTTGFMTIKVKAPDGTLYTYLYQDKTTTQSLLNQAPNSMPYYWNNIPLVLNSQKGWATGVLGTDGKRTYKDGVYSFWTESNLNRMKDNYKNGINDYTGKTVSAVRTVNIASTPVQTTGSVDIKSSPSGATVYIDSVNKGVTPAIISNIAAGSHILLLKKTGYKDYSVSVNVAAGKTTTVNPVLTTVIVRG